MIFRARESSSGILSFRKNDDVRGRKSCGPSVIAPLFLVHTFAIPDHSCLNCEGFARTKDLKDLYLMKNMVMYIVWAGGAFDTVLLLYSAAPLPQRITLNIM